MNRISFVSLLAGVTLGCGSSSDADLGALDGSLDGSLDDGANSDGAALGDTGNASDAGNTGDSHAGDGAGDTRASDATSDSKSSDSASDAGAPSPILGVYCGNNPDDIVQFETWLGRKADGILGYTGAASWTDYDGSVGWATGVWSALDRRVLWSIPLIPKGATLDDAAAGSYDDHYLKAATTLAAYRPSDAVLYVRTGWEFNGNWFPWTAQGHAAAYVGAFEHFVKAFRSVSKRFVIEWNVNVGDVGMNPEDAYPGDDYVDLIGMDFYWNTDYDPKDPEAAWTSMRTRTYGLEWHQAFAATHHKSTTYSEWGIRSDAAAPYLVHVKDWFSTHPVVYQTYWNSDADFPGKLSSDAYPTAGASYRRLFGP